MKHFTMEELTRSATARAQGIPNTPTPEHAAHIRQSVEALLDPLREAWAMWCSEQARKGTPAINVTSGYRSFRLNAAVGGAAASAHCAGYAFDLVPANGRMREFKVFCREFAAGRDFDQLISEDEDAAGVPRWMHLGYKDRQGRQRRQLLTMRGGRYTAMTP